MKKYLFVALTTCFCLAWSSLGMAKTGMAITIQTEEKESLIISEEDLSTCSNNPSLLTPCEVAQTPNVPPGTFDQTPDLPTLPETLPTTPSPSLEVPETTPETPPPIEGEMVTVTAVNVLGNSVFDEEEIAEVINPFIGTEASFEDLLQIRTAITNLYTRRGYTTSGAFLPPQDISDGIITVQVVEGELEEIEILGLERLNEEYVRSRLLLAGKSPVNIQKLERGLQLLQLNPLFSRVQAELKAGTSPGQSVLTLNLTEADNFSAAYFVSNSESPSVGSIRNSAVISHANLLGFGDRFTAEYGFTEGTDEYSINYALPITANNGELTFRYSQGNQLVIEEPFAPLDLNSDTESYSLGIRQPLIYTPNEEFALGLSLDLRRSQTYLFNDIPFSFSVGPEDGESKVSVLRFSQDWLKRSQNRVLAARSQFNLGIDAFDATVNDTGTDGRFFSWIGQFQWVQALNESGLVSVARVTTQLTPDSLLPLEQFSIGGGETVRGYRQNQRVADNGILGSFELRFPIYNQPDGYGLIEVSPFFDVGTVWENSGEIPSPNTLISTGIGLRWQVNEGFEARLDWGIPLNDVDDSGDSLQDQGLVFSVRVQPF